MHVTVCVHIQCRLNKGKLHAAKGPKKFGQNKIQIYLALYFCLQIMYIVHIWVALITLAKGPRSSNTAQYI